MKKRIIMALFLLMAGAFLFTIPASAQGIDLIPDKDDRVVFGGEFTLGAGESVFGDLLSFGGAITLEEGSEVTGSFVSMGGSAEVAGKVAGDLVAFGSSIDLQSSAVVGGDLAMIGADLTRDSGAEVLGDVVTETVPVDLQIPALPNFQIGEDGFNFDFSGPNFDGGPSFDGRDFNFDNRSLTNRAGREVRSGLLNAFALSAIAVIVVLFLPENTKRVSKASLSEPIATGGVSLVSIVVVPVLLVILTLTVILIPVALLLILAVITAILFGWVALGWELGTRLLTALNLDWADSLQAGVGTFVLTFTVSLIGLVPCLGWIAGFLLMLLSFGGVVLTRFGTRDYPESDLVVSKPAKKPAPKKKAAAKRKAPPKKKPPKKAN